MEEDRTGMTSDVSRGDLSLETQVKLLDSKVLRLEIELRLLREELANATLKHTVHLTWDRSGFGVKRSRGTYRHYEAMVSKCCSTWKWSLYCQGVLVGNGHTSTIGTAKSQALRVLRLHVSDNVDTNTMPNKQGVENGSKKNDAESGQEDNHEVEIE